MRNLINYSDLYDFLQIFTIKMKNLHVFSHKIVSNSKLFVSLKTFVRIFLVFCVS